MQESYQLYLSIKKEIMIQIGKLGKFKFPKGDYVYTGSAKKNIDQRIKRHESKNKKLHWHIDFLLNDKNTEIKKVVKSNIPECKLNQKTKGNILINKFGSSDCKNKCKSHLKFIR
jgi:Uri superfamily endonuclease|tara:strand:+ start:471 stop:815 length:345 start_codon:yes stop_codon:yes gene_type:complete